MGNRFIKLLLPPVNFGRLNEDLKGIEALNEGGSVDYSICWTENSDEIKQLQQNLMTEIQAQFGPPERKSFAWVIRDDNQKVIGGVTGFTHWKWSYISQLWVDSSLQGQGLGSQLIYQVEEWSRTQQYVGVYIDTFDAKVSRFYEKRGYQTMGEIPNFPLGHHRYFLYRPLTY